ncbi:MAG TPA: MATE family efflux transporter [Myxococcales bacterium]|jgi:putative MATE family efflux protein
MGSEPIPKLLLEFSLPVMTGMVVQAVYSVVNRAFIGNAPEAATMGMAAITLGMPVVLVSMAFGGLIGFGGAAALSIYLGEQDRERSELALGNVFSLAVLIGLVLTAVGLLFLDPILVKLGATPQSLPYAREYNRLILLGTVPANLGFALSNLIRAEGNPSKSMRIMIWSAVCNAGLDYLFIMVLHWGVRGAALGTVLSQTLVAAQVLLYYGTSRSHVRFRLRSLRLDRAISLRIMSLGSSSFFMFLANSFLQFILNTQLVRYGGDVALAAWGTVHSVTLFCLFPIFGLNGGTQPLVGYNFGARQPARVKSAAKWAIAGASAISTLAFCVVQLFPRAVAGVFSGEDRALLDLCAQNLAISTLLLPVVGFQIIASGYFTSVGKPLQSMFLSLSRQLLILVPLAWLLPRLLGLRGLYFAVPIADGLASLVTLLFFLREMGRLDAAAEASAEAEARAARTSLA